MTSFARHRRSGRVIATFPGFEADLLRTLASQLVELLRNEVAAPAEPIDPLEALVGLGLDGPTTEPDDPVLARLFPTAYPDDEEAAGDFRRYTEPALRTGKAEAAGAIIDALEDAGLPPVLDEQGLVIDVELEPAEADSWLRTLTDLRLALGVRLGVEEDDEDDWKDLPDDDPARQAYEVYQWLAWLQESLVGAVTGWD